LAKSERFRHIGGVTKSALLDELTTTQGVVERKTTIPILSNLLVEAKGSTLTITATDLELSVRTSCEAKIKKEGAGTIPAKKLLELVRLLPEGEIKFKASDNFTVIHDLLHHVACHVDRNGKVNTLVAATAAANDSGADTN
jgi:DNA polymerase III sliding clamp (beta) subunit (PCNA family)